MAVEVFDSVTMDQRIKLGCLKPSVRGNFSVLLVAQENEYLIVYSSLRPEPLVQKGLLTLAKFIGQANGSTMLQLCHPCLVTTVLPLATLGNTAQI